MPFWHLSEGITFTRIDNEGIIVNPTQGHYLSLNAVATRMLTACLEQTSKDAAIHAIQLRINADTDTILRGLDRLEASLRSHRALADRSEE